MELVWKQVLLEETNRCQFAQRVFEAVPVDQFGTEAAVRRRLKMSVDVRIKRNSVWCRADCHVILQREPGFHSHPTEQPSCVCLHFLFHTLGFFSHGCLLLSLLKLKMAGWGLSHYGEEGCGGGLRNESGSHLSRG